MAGTPRLAQQLAAAANLRRTKKSFDLTRKIGARKVFGLNRTKCFHVKHFWNNSKYRKCLRLWVSQSAPPIP